MGFSLLYIYIAINDLKGEINTSLEIESERVHMLDVQISKMNVLIGELETFLKKTKIPAIE